MSKIDTARAWDAIHAARDAEREHCAALAEQMAADGYDGYRIAKVIRAGKRTRPMYETEEDAEEAKLR